MNILLNTHGFFGIDTTKDIVLTVFCALGGLALFIFGLKQLSTGLRSLSDTKLRKAISKIDNPYIGILVGLIFTAAIQSSDGCVIIALSLLSARMIKLETAIGIALGANIGTTITAFMVSAKLDEFAGIFVVIGVIMVIASKSALWKDISSTILGFGLTFFALLIMGHHLKDILELATFKNSLHGIDNRFAGLGMGTGLTLMVQSSSASTGLIQTTFESGGLQPLVAVSMIIGANIGTTFTAIIASLGGNRDAKRLALVHLMVNTVMALIYLPLMSPLTNMLVGFNMSPRLTLAMGHIFFNISLVLIFTGLIRPLAALVRKIIKVQDVHFSLEVNLDERLITESPALALASIRETIANFNKLTEKILTGSYKFIKEPSKELKKEIDALEEQAMQMKRIIDTYIGKLLHHTHSDKENGEAMRLIFINRDFEKTCRIAKNIAKIVGIGWDSKAKLTPDMEDEIAILAGVIFKMSSASRNVIGDYNKSSIKEVDRLERKLDALIQEFQERHVKLEGTGQRPDSSKLDYTTLLIQIERMGDHIHNSSKYFRRKMISSNIEKRIKDVNEELQEIL